MNREHVLTQDNALTGGNARTRDNAQTGDHARTGDNAQTGKYVLTIENLQSYFFTAKGTVPAVDDVTIEVPAGKIIGLVGESGCGKTTTGRAISRLYEPTDGTVRYDGADITHLSAREFMAYRKKIQMIFQDPYASLNPRMTVRTLWENRWTFTISVQERRERSTFWICFPGSVSIKITPAAIPMNFPADRGSVWA